MKTDVQIAADGIISALERNGFLDPFGIDGQMGLAEAAGVGEAPNADDASEKMLLWLVDQARNA